jgi:acyl-CoA thioester hydrolase
MLITPTSNKPLRIHREKVRKEWIDYNGHLNMAYYLLAFDHATDAFFDCIGVGEEYSRMTDGTTFTLEGHISYLREVKENDSLRFETFVFDYDQKRIHYAHAMYQNSENYVAATNELMTLHVSQSKRRAYPIPDLALSKLETLKNAHEGLTRPPSLSRIMGLTQKKRNSTKTE